jgi:hypothetical protein
MPAAMTAVMLVRSTRDYGTKAPLGSWKEKLHTDTSSELVLIDPSPGLANDTSPAMRLDFCGPF